MKKIVVFCVAVLIAVLSAMPVMAYDRTADAVVYADFEGEDTELSIGSIPAGTGTYLNGIGENTKASISDGALKIELDRAGFVVLGSDNVVIRDTDGNLNYKYLVIRIKGEAGNENRTETGGLLLFIGGGDGSHAVTLNDRSTGAAPSALDAKGKPMNAISTEWQEFVIALTDTNVRVNPDKPVNGLNINSVSNAATIYIDDIYFSNKAPSTAAVYDPATSTDAIIGADDSESESDESSQTSAGTDSSAENNSSESNESSGSDFSVTDGSSEETESSGEVIENAAVERLDPPKRDKETASDSQSNTLSIIALIISVTSVVLLAVVLTLLYIKVVLKS